MLELRPYQQAADQSAWEWLHAPESRTGLVIAPVGSGKALLIAELIKRISLKYPRTKILVLSHIMELLQQNAEHLIKQWPEADICFYSAGLGQKRLHSDIIFAGVQSVHNKIAEFARCPSIILVDEAHSISHKSETQYRKFIDDIFAINPNARLIGFTGSPFRADTGRLDEGDNRLFHDIIYQIEMRYLIEQGYLCKPVTPKVLTHMDVTGVQTRGGDYVESQLQVAVDRDEITKACVDEIIVYGHDRKKWLIFTSGIKHCENVRDEICSRGIKCEMVLGNSSDRKEVFNEFKNGDVRCLVNVAVATTGINIPAIDLIAFMRPTRSPVLFLQMSGRGLRLSPGKPDCAFLDFGGIIRELGPLDALDIRKRYSENKYGEKALPVTKICPSCGTVCFGGQKYCYTCMYEFPMGTELDKRAEREREIMSFGEPEKISVLSMSTKIHKSKNKPDGPITLRVSYYCLNEEYSEYVCFNHKGYARDRAVLWHKKMRPDLPIPETVEAAADINYPKPNEIEVRQEGKYWRVLNVLLPENAMDKLSIPEGDFEEVEF